MKIRIKSGDCHEYLTMGKVYEVAWAKYGDMCEIVDDYLDYCLIDMNNDYLNLNGGSWEIVDD